MDQSIEQQVHISLPQLRGQPAYARPRPVAVDVAPRPFDPDDLPLDADMTQDERELAMSLPEKSYAFPEQSKQQATASNGHDGHHLLPRPFRIRSLVGRSNGSSE